MLNSTRTMMRTSSYLLCLFFLFTSLLLHAQDYSGYTWYLGNRVVEFNRSNTTPTGTASPVPLAGPGAVVADPANGDVLFYTDGTTIYDVSNQAMPNGSGLTAGTSLNQPVVVAQVPGSTDRYYVITNSATGQIQMTVVDMTLPGNPSAQPLGDVDPTIKNAPVGALTGQSQAMITIPRGTNGEFWLITHTEGSNTYNVTLFNSTGPVSTTSVSGVGLITSAGNFAYNPETGQLAVSPDEANRNIELLNFDPASGTLLPGNELANTSVSTATNQGIYDVEWSPSGQYLYVSRSGEDGQPDLLQYDLSTIDPVTGIIVPVSVLPQPNTITASYGLQTGPDGAIYHLYESGGVIRMGKITNPDNPATSTTPGATLDYVAVAVQGAFNVKQFPATLAADPVVINIDFVPTEACQGVPVQFFPTVDPPVDSLVWTVDGIPMNTPTSDYSPVFTFDTSGPHLVEVTAYLGGESQVFSKTVDVVAFDTQITLEPEVTGCHEEFTKPKVKPPGWVPCGTGSTPCLTVTATTSGTPPTNIRWYGPEGEIVGNNTLTLTPEGPGYYYMVAEGGACNAYAGVNVKEYDVPDPRANVWYFGNGAGLDFNPLFQTPQGEVTDISNGAMNAPEGSATISDRNGQVVLYTDGVSVWSRFGGTTPIATNIGGSNTATQSSLIMSVPGDETLYYIFTTQEITEGTYELRYTLFDLKLNGGTGGIVDPDNDPTTNPPSTVLFTNSTEKLVAVGDWVIVHEYGNNTLRAYEITPTGIAAPVFSNVGSDHSVTSTNTGEGYMMYAGGRLAVALPPDKVEVFDFDAATGEITNPLTIPVAGGEPYGVNFSSDGNRMYVTVQGSNNILEYEFNGTTFTLLGNVIMPAGQPTGQPGAMQYGPDGQLYVAVVGENQLGIIQPQTNTGQLSTYVPDVSPEMTGTVTLGLPNFVQQLANPINEPSLVFTPGCIDTDITFTASGKDATIDIFNWEFSDGTIINDGGPEIVKNYPTAGPYWVKVTITNKCETDYFIQQTDFNVAPLPPVPPMANGAPAVICSNAGVTLFGSAPPTADPNLDYLWNTGATTFSLQATTPGTYSVTVTDRTTQCTNTASETVVPTFTFDLGPDLYLCQGTTQTLSVNFLVNVTYAWFENGTPINVPNTQSSIPVNTTTAGAKTYRVEVSNGICTISDEVTYTVSAIPTFTANGVNSATCGPGGNGSINLNITAPAIIPLQYEVTSSTGSIVASGSNVTTVFNTSLTPLAADVYTVVVADQLTGCGAAQTVSINANLGPTFSVAPSSGCHPNMTLDVTNIVGTGPYTYDIFNTTSPSAVRSGTETGPSFTSATLPAVDGNYTLRLIDANGCSTGSPSVLVQQNAPFQVTFDGSQLCANQQIAAVISPADPAATFQWTAQTTQGTGDGIVSTSGTTAKLATGTWVVKATASSPTELACPGTGTVTVNVEAPIVADFTQSNECVNPVVLTATPTGSTYTYRWTENNIVTNNFAPTLTVGPAKDRFLYQVTVTNSATGCANTSTPAKEVRVISPFTVTINVPPIACEDTDIVVSVSPSRPDVTQFQWFINGATQTETGSSITSRTAGTYRVIGILENCFSPPDEGTVTVTPKPEVTLGPLQRICPFPQAPVELRSVVIEPEQGPFSAYQWFLVEENIVTDLGSDDPTYTANAAGTYRVTVTDGNGCVNSSDVDVIEDCDPIVTGPNAFHPGSSLSANKAFSLFTFFITDEDFKIIIFNRWGEMIYESTDRFFLWNGTYGGDGNILPAGTYAYLVQYKSEYHPEQGIREKRGGVLLVR
jgi:large repetitive protein